MADVFELMKLWVPLGEGGYSEKGWGYIIPENNAKTEMQWQKAQQLAREGWELVSAVPMEGQKGSADMATNYTVGYVLFFKRRISQEPQPRPKT